MMIDPASLDGLWNYGDPAASEARFIARRAEESDPSALAEIDTQIARTLGLRREFEGAHALLDEVEPIAKQTGGRLLVRYHLERGRAFNSSGEKTQARTHFLAALESEGGDFYRVDALHMMGIVAEDEESLDWNRKAIAEAEASDDPRTRNWLGSLTNNTGWSLHAMGRYDEALELFEKALQFRESQGKPDLIGIARWCVARCKRSLGRLEEALAEQRELEAEAGEATSYNAEELGECLLALGRREDAQPYFRAAYTSLSQDPWLVENEPDRLKRLSELADGAESTV